MAADRSLPLGIFTTDGDLVVRTWDAWTAAATGIAPARALNHTLTDVLPEIDSPGLLGIFHNVLARGTVEVLAAALHPYLFACAPADPSPMCAHMQQHVTIGPLRDQGRVVGLIVTIEDVTSRVERERHVGGAPRRKTAAAGSPGERSEQQIASLTRLLGEPAWRVRRAAVTTLAEHGQAIVGALVRTLREQHGNVHVLSSALDLLAVSDIDVLRPLIGFLDDADANLRMHAALILGERRDRRAIPSLIPHLDDPDVNVRFHVIEALGRLHATEAREHLAAVAEQRDFFLAFPAIQALRRVGTPEIAPRLVPLLADELLRSPVIEALGELGDEEVSVPLVRLLNASSTPTDVIADALAGLYDRYQSRHGAGEHIAALVRRTISASGTQQILDAVQRAGPDRLPGLAKVLGWLEGDAVQRALTRLLGRGAVRSQVVEALVRNGSGVVALLTEQLGAEDLETRQAAAVALGRIGDRRATPGLVAALRDPELTLAAAGALARIGDGAAFEPLMRFLGDPDAALRRAVIAALNSIGHRDMPRRVAGLLKHPDPVVRESALRIAGYFGYAECLAEVLACCRDVTPAVRRTAVEQLAFFDDARVVDPLFASLADAVPSVRSAAVTALARLDHPARVDSLLSALQDPDSWVRYAALTSLAAIGATRGLPAVVACLQHDPAPHVRLAAIDVVGRLGAPDALAILAPLIHSANHDIARAAVEALGHVEHADALAVLEQVLRAPVPWLRAAAAGALSRRRDAGVPDLLQWRAATDSDPAVAQAAVDALTSVASREGPEATGAVRALLLLTAEPICRQVAISALGTLPSRRVADIVGGLTHPSPEVRCAGIEALSRMQRPEASRALESALDDPAPQVRLAVVAELKHLGSRSAETRLMAMARTDSDPAVRRAAMLAVARIDASEAKAMESR